MALLSNEQEVIFLRRFCSFTFFFLQMGVKKLWSILQRTSTRVEPQSLEYLKLAVDISIWLNRFLKVNTEDLSELNPLIALFHRCCKLIFFGIKPVFVFDGSTPRLKEQTIKKRKLLKDKQEKKKTDKVENEFLNQLLNQALQSSDKYKQYVSPSPKSRLPSSPFASPSPRINNNNNDDNNNNNNNNANNDNKRAININNNNGSNGNNSSNKRMKSEQNEIFIINNNEDFKYTTPKKQKLASSIDYLIPFDSPLLKVLYLYCNFSMIRL